MSIRWRPNAAEAEKCLLAALIVCPEHHLDVDINAGDFHSLKEGAL